MDDERRAALVTTLMMVPLGEGDIRRQAVVQKMATGCCHTSCGTLEKMTMSANPLAGFLAAEGRGGEGGRTQVDAILGAVRNHLGMEIAFASKFVDGRREFTHLNSDLALPAKVGDSEPLEDGYCWHILQGRLPELIQNAQDLPFAKPLAITSALPVGCHISVPLRLKDGSVYGSFCCLSRTPDYSLTDRDLSTVRAFADLAVDQIEMERASHVTRDEAVGRIQAAIAGRQPSIFLQPIHDLATGTTAGAEALARFVDAGTRPPNLWFEEAFDVGLGVELELAAVRQGLKALPYVPAGHYLSLNVSPETVLSGRLPDALAPAKGCNLVLEVTEHSRVDDYAGLRSRLAELRPLARIAIDDVGAGYAGLRHIIALEPDILKLDISLTRDIHEDAAKRALTVAMVSFAARIGCKIVAEGIERQEERKVLQDLGVSHGQGWLFSRAMPPVAAQQMMLGTDTEVAPLVTPMRHARFASRH